MSSRTKLLVSILLAVTGAFALSVLALEIKFRNGANGREAASPQAREELSPIKALPDFQLTERSGKTVRLADLKGKVWLADFVYTTCTGPCPMISHHLASLQNRTLENADVRFVSISTDPAHDTPDVLQKYAGEMHASPDKWLFLTGEKAQVYDLIEHGFLLPVVEQPNEPQPIMHSTRLALVDKRGVIRAFYDGTEGEGDERILRDIARLLAEPAQ